MDRLNLGTIHGLNEDLLRAVSQPNGKGITDVATRFHEFMEQSLGRSEATGTTGDTDEQLAPIQNAGAMGEGQS